MLAVKEVVAGKNIREIVRMLEGVARQHPRMKWLAHHERDAVRQANPYKNWWCA